MRGGFKRNRGHDQRVGARLPQKMQEEIAEQGEKDDRKFNRPAHLKGPSRKELRKQKRLEKRKRNAAYHSGRPVESAAKRQKTQGVAEEKKKKQQQQPKDSGKANEKKQEKQKSKSNEFKSALERMSKSNPNVYSLLQSDNLVSSTEGNTSKRDFDEDDREIAYWEKKLGINKKKKTNINKALEADGLLDLLDGLGSAEISRDKDDEMLMSEDEEEQEDGDMVDDSEDDEDDSSLEKELVGGSSDEEEDETMEQDEALSSEEEIDESEEASDNDEDTEEVAEQSKQIKSSDEESSDEDQQKNVDNEKQSEAKKPETPAAGRYIPPHLRKAASGLSEQQLKLQRTLQGLLNRLSESNLESILFEVEKCYTNYTRHDVTSTITNLILTSIAQKSNLLDSFVITYAAVVGGLYRLVGIDFVAHFVQTLVERFESNYQKCEEAIKSGDIQEADDETTPGAREAKNLLTLALELYNFQVIACILVYDLVRLLIANLDEYSVELLLKIVKTAGGQLRSDDPGSLKAIIDEIQKETAKRDAKSISTRHKFMLETLANIKNNKIKTGPTAAGQADKELVLKLKKFLNSLGKKRTVRSSEALRVSLEDIHQIETKGKWWLVGASWKDNMVGTESKHASQAKIAEDLRKDQSMQQALLKLARKQGMNTDIRRSIFVTIMSAEDYLDAFEKVMKLGLTEVQQREIARVLLQCTGNEKTFNPYYMLLSRKLCQTSHSFKVTYQYCLWDFLRECGETDVGGLERTMHESQSTPNGSKVRLSRIVNVAKLYAAMIASGALSLSVLRSLNFMTLGNNGRLWLELLFINIFAQAKQEGPQTIVNVFSKILEMRTLAQGCLFFLQESVVGGVNSGYGGVDPETVRWGCKLAREVLRK